jgi:hypothetical protein
MLAIQGVHCLDGKGDEAERQMTSPTGSMLGRCFLLFGGHEENRVHAVCQFVRQIPMRAVAAGQPEYLSQEVHNSTVNIVRFFMLHPVGSRFIDNQLTLVAEIEAGVRRFEADELVLLAPENERRWQDSGCRSPRQAITKCRPVPVQHPSKSAGLGPRRTVMLKVVRSKSAGPTGSLQ